jgi:hypothetical protein
MAVTSQRSISINFTGDVSAANTLAAANNVSSPAGIESKTLASGANTITPPTGTTAVTIIPPAANTVGLTLKGVTGDTGVALHLTDPTSIGLAGVTAFCLTAVSGVTVRLIWS